MRRSKGYDLPGCIILAAAVYGTKKAYDAAMAMLPMARRLEGREETVAEGSRFAKDEYRAPASATTYGLLDWARSRVSKGRGLPGVVIPPAPVVLQTVRHGKRGQQRAVILEMITEEPMTVQEISALCGISGRLAFHHLQKLAQAGQAVHEALQQVTGKGGAQPRVWRSA